jgi:hypothetical protein
MSERWKFSVMQGEVEVASGEAADKMTAQTEGFHYALQYSADGPVKVDVFLAERKAKEQA